MMHQRLVLLFFSNDKKNVHFVKFYADLPSSFESASCHIKEPIYHLKPFERNCLVSSYEDLQQIELDFLQFAEKYRIFQIPHITDDIYTKYLQSFTGNITIYKCLEGVQNCSHYKYAKANVEDVELFKIRVNILHNFTNIHGAVVELWFRDLKEEKYLQNTRHEHYWLSYKTEFFNKSLNEFNTTNNRVATNTPLVSGPLGYLAGKPLIIARYEPFNKSLPLTVKNQVINYFSIHNTEPHALTLLAKTNGECKRSKYYKEYISYGINVAKHCKIKLENNTLSSEEPSNTNFTQICIKLQQRIHEQLFGRDLDVEDLSSYFISQLGKPQNISNKWQKLQVYNTNYNSIIGQYLHETNTFVCRNILLSLTYQFHMATVVVDDVPLQNIISYAVLHLAERHDLEFSLNENLEVPITMSVRFFDVHEDATSAAYNFKHFNIIFRIILIITKFSFLI